MITQLRKTVVGMSTGQLAKCGNSRCLGLRRWGWRAIIGLLVTGAGLAGSLQAQVVATWTGGGNGTHYSDPNNWSTGVVPINGGGTNYNLVVPNSRNIIFDVAGSVSGVSYGTGGSITVASGVAFNVDSVASLGSNIFADGAGTSFTANGVGVALGTNVRSIATNGARISYSANQYNRSSAGNSVVFQANGIGSVVETLNMSSISNTVGFTGSGQYYTTSFIAENGGLLDFSNVQTINGGSIGSNRWARNLFRIDSGGDIDLTSLKSLTQYNRFEIGVANYSLPSLESVEGLEIGSMAIGTTFNTNALVTVGGMGSSIALPTSSTWNANSLTTLNNTSLSLAIGATLNAPNVTTFRDSSVSLEPGKNFNTGLLTSIDNSRFNVSGGTVLELGAASFNSSVQTSRTAFRVDGPNSQIVASNLNSITNTIGFSGSEQYYTTSFIAENGGLLDFSNVQTINGGSIGSNRWARNLFRIDSGGDINLTNLKSLTQYNRFEIGIANYSLPSLESAEGLEIGNMAVGTTFNTNALVTVGGMGSSIAFPTFSTWNANSLAALNNTSLSLAIGATLNAPNLTTFRDSSVSLEPGKTFNTGLLTSIDNSRFNVSGGTVLELGAASFNSSVQTSRTAFRVDGPSSQIVASNLNSITNTIGFSGSGQYYTTSFIAENGGLLDFSNVQTIDGGSIGSNRWARNNFLAQSGGQILLGDVATVDYNTFEVDGGAAAIRTKGLSLNSLSSFSATNLGTLQLSGSLSHVHTNAANFNFDNGRIAFRDVELAELEIAGRNLGFNVNGLGNFGYQQMTIGGLNAPATVILADRVNNGNRVNGMSEVQYLLDVTGDGLVINSGSQLILNGYDMFISNGQDSFFSARDLIAPGQISVAYGNGVISLTGDRGQILNPGFESVQLPPGSPQSSVAKLGWNQNGPGSARIVEAGGGNQAMELQAGSPIELSQFVSTLNEDFEIKFDARALNNSGLLTLKLDNQVLQSWTWSEIGTQEFTQFTFLVSASNLLNRIDVPLAFVWDGNAGHKVWLDNIMMVAVVPEPSSATLLLVGLAFLNARRRRSI